MGWWLLQHLCTTGILIGLMLSACRKLPKRPALQHGLWVIVLIKFLVPPFVTWPWSLADAGQIFSWHLPGVSRKFELSGAMPGVAINAMSSIGAFSEGRLAHRLGQVALLTWAAGAMLAAGKQGRRIWGQWRGVRHAGPAPECVRNQVGQMAREMGVRSMPVLVLPGVASPFVWCLGRLTMIWPEHLASESQLARLRGVIVHELAHIRRRDHWIIWLELIVGILWWWNPLAWIVRRRVDEAAEIACDALVVSVFPEGRREYAEALLELSLPFKSSDPVPAMGVNAGERKSFERRLMMILSNTVTSRISLRGLILIGIVALAALPSWSLGQIKRDGPDAGSLETARASGERTGSVAFYLAETISKEGLNPAEVAGNKEDLVYLHQTPIMTRDDVDRAGAILDGDHVAVEIKFTNRGQERIGRATAENIGKRLAIVVDGKVISAPKIRGKITDSAKLTGRFGKDEAELLARSIRPRDEKAP
ncbi:MAG TPA: M56 family metallopeptidase [Pirellulales bacterium]|nr:M56 family metallopeptidase [Pirellulales bacterium]